jgi:hypothetical protein
MAGKYDGHQWGEIYRFQTHGLPGTDGLEGLSREEQLLDLAAFLAKDAGYFASRAQQYFHQVRGGNGAAPPPRNSFSPNCAAAWPTSWATCWSPPSTWKQT